MAETPAEPAIRMLGEGRFLRLAAQGKWEYAQRINCSGAVAVVAVTPERELLLVEQLRVPVGKHVIELPAGLVGDAGYEDEELTLAANRELIEEAGYEATHVEFLACGPTTPGLTSEQIAIVKATGLRKVGEGGGVDGEEIVVHCVALAQLSGWLKQAEARGGLIDHKLYAGLFLAGLASEVG